MVVGASHLLVREREERMPEQAGTQGRVQMVEMDLWKQAELSGATVRREDSKLVLAFFSPLGFFVFFFCQFGGS